MTRLAFTLRVLPGLATKLWRVQSEAGSGR